MENGSNEDRLQISLAVIGKELQSAQVGAEHLRSVYEEAAITSDLTFIKILEEKYTELTTELDKLYNRVSNVLSEFENGTGGANNGRED